MHLAKDQSLLQVNATILSESARSVQTLLGGRVRKRYSQVRVRFVAGQTEVDYGVSKKLRVFGVLFNVGDEHVPFLRTKYLDEAAGIVPAISQGRNPIVALGRGRIQWARKCIM